MDQRRRGGGTQAGHAIAAVGRERAARRGAGTVLWTATVKDYRQHSYTLTEGEASRLGDRLYELAEDIGAAADLTACAPLD